MQHYDVSDQELIAGYLNGNPKSFEKLMNRHKAKLFSSIFYLVRNKEQAEDIFQETFIRIINRINKGGYYKDQGKFLAWATRVARNIVIDEMRVNKRRPLVRDKKEYSIMDSLKLQDDNVETKMIRNQITTQLRMLIEELPYEQREVVIMRCYGDLTFKEIAALTHENLNTTLGRMRYALRNLRKLVKAKNYSTTL